MLIAFAALLAAAPDRCLPPTVMLSGNDKELTVRFWAGTPRRRTLEENVRAAFKSACRHHLLTGSTILRMNGVSTRRLFLENQPNANAAMLEADQRPDGSWRLVLAYPFVGADRSMNVPSATEIQEAIYCAVRGASAQEQARSGRCLPD
jgi:hypothetical protein